MLCDPLCKHGLPAIDRLMPQEPSNSLLAPFFGVTRGLGRACLSPSILGHFWAIFRGSCRSSRLLPRLIEDIFLISSIFYDDKTKFSDAAYFFC